MKTVMCTYIPVSSLNAGYGGCDYVELFSRALRLRWLWLEWTDEDRPWAGTTMPWDAVDRQLFRTSTLVTIGMAEKLPSGTLLP